MKGDLHAVELALGSVGVVLVARAGLQRDAVRGDQSDQRVEQRREVRLVRVQEEGLAREKRGNGGTSCGRGRGGACRATSARRPLPSSFRFYDEAPRECKLGIGGLVQ